MNASSCTLSGLSALAASLLLSGCVALEDKVYSTPTTVPEIPAPPAAVAGTIGSPYAGMVLFEDAKARAVGDLLTIQLVESTSAQKSATTDSSKSDNDTLGNIGIFGKTIHTNSSVSSSRAFKGAGDSAQSNSLTGSITVAVVQRLDNGNLVVRGKKQIQINQGYEYVTLEGVIRPADIATDNSVTSDRVANARISYTGKGQIADANAQGWLTRFFNSQWFPF
ncbi:MAG: flagellar basal body L-ring protein FlgH [Nevskia sp.]|nr:flagellar basal body L-ring protein FlgH [Nevskia sp.]